MVREEVVANSDLLEEEASKEIDLLATEIEDFKGVVDKIESEKRIQRAPVKLSVSLAENLLIRKNKRKDLMLS